MSRWRPCMIGYWGRVAEYAEEGEDYSWAIEENRHFILHPSNTRQLPPSTDKASH